MRPSSAICPSVAQFSGAGVKRRRRAARPLARSAHSSAAEPTSERAFRAARAGEDFRGDEQAREVFGEFARRDAIEQAERARHEDGVQEIARAFQRGGGANAEREAVRLARPLAGAISRPSTV